MNFWGNLKKNVKLPGRISNEISEGGIIDEVPGRNHERIAGGISGKNHEEISDVIYAIFLKKYSKDFFEVFRRIF